MSTDLGPIVDVEGVLLDALEGIGIAASAVIRINPEDVHDADLERLPYVHVAGIDGGESNGPWRMDPYLLTCYGATPAQAFDLAARVMDLVDEPMWSPTYGLVDCAETEGPVRDPGFDGDPRVCASLVRVFAETRRGPGPTP